MMNTRMMLMMLLCALLLSPVAAQNRRGQQNNPTVDGFPPRAPRETEMAPDVELLDAEGTRLRLSELRGKWVVLDFNENGHTIADPKRESMNAIRAKFAENSEVVFLTILSPEKAGENGRIGRPDRTEARNMMEATNNGYAEHLKDRESLYPGARLVTDGATMLARLEYGAFVNMTYLLNPDGRVARRWAWNDPMQLESELDVRTGNSGAPKVAVFGGTVAPAPPPRASRGNARERARDAGTAQDLVLHGSAEFLRTRDRDGDGFLSPQESGLRQQQFTRADLDGDGKLSAEELTIIRNFLEENMPQLREL